MTTETRGAERIPRSDNPEVYTTLGDWLDGVLMEQGDECDNCGTWRVLLDGRDLERCASCGDDQIDVYDAATAGDIR